jgi:hypothetical protein
MAHTHTTHLHPHAHTHTHSLPTSSHEDLRQQWDQLPLHPQTREHLEQVLITQGVDLATAATLALSLELAREERQVTRSLWGWLLEELRLLFLEEGCQHLIEAGRLLIDVLLAWLLVQGPWLLSRLLGPLLLLLLLPVALCLLPMLRARRR